MFLNIKRKKKKSVLLGRFIRLTMSGKTSDILGKFFAFKSTPKTVNKNAQYTFTFSHFNIP